MAFSRLLVSYDNRKSEWAMSGVWERKEEGFFFSLPDPAHPMIPTDGEPGTDLELCGSFGMGR